MLTALFLFVPRQYASCPCEVLPAEVQMLKTALSYHQINACSIL